MRGWVRARERVREWATGIITEKKKKQVSREIRTGEFEGVRKKNAKTKNGKRK